jgi:hypothetical protein
MLFHFYGHPLSQTKIVEEVYGMPVNFPSQTGRVIAAQLNKKWKDDNRVLFRSRIKAAYDFQAGVANLNNRVLVKELNSGHPLIIGVGGHAVILTAVDYAEYPNGFIDVIRALVFDPWPGRGPRYLTRQEKMPVWPWGYTFAVTARIEELSSKKR